MTHPVIQRRLAEQKEMIDRARGYVKTLRARLPIERAWVAGSVARGDFNLWSDIDVVLVVRALPERAVDRHGLFPDRPPGVEIIPYTPEEFERARAKKNPLVLEALHQGVDLLA